MGFWGIRQHLEKLWSRWTKTVESFTRQKQTIECTSRVGAGGQRPAEIGWQFGTRSGVKDTADATPSGTQRTLEMPGRAGALSVRKQFRADEIAREILGTSSAATISNVLVIGSEGFPSFKRVQIRFDDPRQVPAVFILLATALQSAGVDFNTTRNSSIPSAEIWLVSPLDDWSRTVLSCAAPIGEQPIPDTLSRPASREPRPRIEHQFPDSAAV
ncbi:MAG TPA: hypothetical protein VFR24_25860 [Candidatus Angelobacter sp.]|nr:hypothetical protein [Candidatus Angelobacter sp.]